MYILNKDLLAIGSHITFNFTIIQWTVWYHRYIFTNNIFIFYYFPYAFTEFCILIITLKKCKKKTVIFFYLKTSKLCRQQTLNFIKYLNFNKQHSFNKNSLELIDDFCIKTGIKSIILVISPNYNNYNFFILEKPGFFS